MTYLTDKPPEIVGPLGGSLCSLWCLVVLSERGTPSLGEVRAEGWSELSPRCVGAAARRAGLSPLFCDAPISRRPVCFLMHTLPPFGPAELGGFFLEFLRTDSEFGASRPLRERIRGNRGLSFLRSFFSRLEPRFRRPGQKLFCFWVWLLRERARGRR